MAKYQKGTFITVPNRQVLRGMKGEYQSVYQWLNSFADENGECYPSRATLAECAGCSLRMVDYALKEFEEKGLVIKTIRKNGNQNMTSLYQITIVEGGSARSAPPSSKKDTTPSVENATGTKPSINSNHLTSSKTEVLQEENPSFEEYLNGIGKQYIEKSQGGEVKDVWCDEDEKPISKSRMDSYEREYSRKYKNTGLENIIPNAKRMSEVEHVFHLFKTPAKSMWYSNKTQRKSAEELLKVMEINQIVQILRFVEDNQGDILCPKINSPYTMLNKLADLDYYKKNNHGQKRDNPFRKINVGNV